VQAKEKKHLSRPEADERLDREVHVPPPERASPPQWLPKRLHKEFLEVGEILLAAGLYAELDRGRKRLTLPQSLNAMMEAGTDPEIMEVKRLTEGAGFVWALVKRTGQPFEIEATRALISAYRLLGVAGFSRLLELVAGTWHGAPSSLKASMLSGMALFLKTYEAELNDRAFIRRLSNLEPEEIIQASRVEYSAALRFARTIRDCYNAQGGGQELPYRFKR